MIISKQNLKPQKAFTLVELLIVIAIIGILASIAIPSYQKSVSKSRRADAKGALLGFANAMERHFTENNSYCEAGTTTSGSCDDATGAPTIYSTQSPVDGGTVYYNLTINAADDTTFTLHAAPTGIQANDDCGTLTLAHTGARGVSGATLTAADCW
jgi:type IV pilus assembly protein PilE